MSRKFALGVRFARYQDGGLSAEFAFEKLFSVLSIEQLADMDLFGTQDAQQEVYLAVLMSDSLNAIRQVYQALSKSPEFMALLARDLPFIENNRIRHLTGLTCYGTVRADGSIEGGDKKLAARPKQAGQNL